MGHYQIINHQRMSSILLLQLAEIFLPPLCDGSQHRREAPPLGWTPKPGAGVR